ncbi:MAG TPA: MBL fold metallo-hydrolase [Thermoleophilaceae bacterium]|nr:MBL fold metallo-hydrolase [Thermoleophilaceae bacterium]
MLERDAAEGIHRVEDGYVNFFLVEDGAAVTVVDAGHPSSWGPFQQALREIGSKPQDVEALVLTHGHFDHMGFADRARRELGVPLWTHPEEVSVARHPWRYDHERSRLPYLRNPSFARVLASMTASGALWVKGTDEVNTFEAPNGHLDVPGRPRPVFTPGHTHGHCSLHFPDRGAVITGDAVVMLDVYTGRTGPRIVAGAATADSARALSSLEAIASTGAQTVLPGHGDTWRDGARKAAEQAAAAGPS